MGWIGVDLDGTLAHYEKFGVGEIGEPVALMLTRVKWWLGQGQHVKIVTGRARDIAGRIAVAQWATKHIGRELPVTDKKDFDMSALWDDRAVQVIKNTGVPVQYLVSKNPLHEKMVRVADAAAVYVHEREKFRNDPSSGKDHMERAYEALIVATSEMLSKERDDQHGGSQWDLPDPNP